MVVRVGMTMHMTAVRRLLLMWDRQAEQVAIRREAVALHVDEDRIRQCHRPWASSRCREYRPRRRGYFTAPAFTGVDSISKFALLLPPVTVYFSGVLLWSA